MTSGSRMMPQDLDDLVGRTSGAQPWRRLFHATTGVLVVLALEVVGIPMNVVVTLLAIALVLLLASDLARARKPEVNALFFRIFQHLASPRDASGLASSTWYTLGMLIVLALFPRAAAISAILVLAIADPVASYCGRRWGRIPLLGGSLEGSLLFTTIALLILVPRHGVLAAVVTALCATIAERVSWPLDDNVTVPVTTAAILTAYAALL